MAEINGVAESTAAVVVQQDDLENRNTEQDSEEQNAPIAVDDSVALSDEGLELAQAVQPVEQPAEQDQVEQQAAEPANNDEEEAVPSFLDIRA